MVVFFAALRKPVPFPTGAILEFTSADDSRPKRGFTDPADRPIPPLEPDAPEGISLRFWQMEKSPRSLLEPQDLIGSVTRLVVPEFSPAEDADLGPEVDTTSATVMEMGTHLPDYEDSVQLAFRRCLACLEDVSRAYAIALRPLVEPLSVGDIHPFVLFISRPAGPEGRWRLGFSLYLIPGSFEADYLTDDELDTTDVEKFDVSLFRLREGDPFALYSERALRCETALLAGEFGESVVQAAVGAEVLLDALLGLMIWEEQLPIPDAAAALKKSVAERMRTEYDHRLGGSWDQSASGAIGRWRREIADQRNRVLHRGYRPKEEEAAAARSAKDALAEFVRELLVDRREQYWRTALLLLGIPGLTARRAWDEPMQRLLAKSGEDPDDWHRAYGAWREQVDSAIWR